MKLTLYSSSGFQSVRADIDIDHARSAVYVIVFRFSTELCAVLRLSGPLKSQYAKVCIIYVYKSFIITYYFVIILYCSSCDISLVTHDSVSFYIGVFSYILVYMY